MFSTDAFGLFWVSGIEPMVSHVLTCVVLLNHTLSPQINYISMNIFDLHLVQSTNVEPMDLAI